MRKLSKIAPDSEEEVVPTDIRCDGAMSELGQEPTFPPGPSIVCFTSESGR
jgi:hypothetical protein